MENVFIKSTNKFLNKKNVYETQCELNSICISQKEILRVDQLMQLKNDFKELNKFLAKTINKKNQQNYKNMYKLNKKTIDFILIYIINRLNLD